MSAEEFALSWSSMNNLENSIPPYQLTEELWNDVPSLTIKASSRG